RMPANKGRRGQGGATGHGLADLKRLRKEAEAAKEGDSPRTGSDPDPGPHAGTEPSTRRRTGVRPRSGSDPSKTNAIAAGVRPHSGSDPETLPREDAELFRRAVKSVIRLKDSNRAVLPPVPTAPTAVLAERRARAMGRDVPVPPQISDQFSPPGIEQDDSCYLRPDCGPDLLRDLRRGKWPLGASLVLDGSNLQEERERLDRYLQSCVEHQVRGLRILHRKGYGSMDSEPVLRQPIRGWLSQLA